MFQVKTELKTSPEQEKKRVRSTVKARLRWREGRKGTEAPAYADANAQGKAEDPSLSLGPIEPDVEEG